MIEKTKSKKAFILIIVICISVIVLIGVGFSVKAFLYKASKKDEDSKLSKQVESTNSNNDLAVSSNSDVSSNTENSTQPAADSVLKPKISREELVRKVESQTNMKIVEKFTAYEDFDSDGNYEMFTVLEPNGDEMSRSTFGPLCFVNASNVTEITSMTDSELHTMQIGKSNNLLIYILISGGQIVGTLDYTCKGDEVIDLKDEFDYTPICADENNNNQLVRIFDTYKVRYLSDSDHTHIAYPVYYEDGKIKECQYEKINFYGLFEKNLEFQNVYKSHFGFGLFGGNIKIENAFKCENGMIYISFVKYNENSDGYYGHIIYNSKTNKIEERLGYFDPISDTGDCSLD